MSLEYSNIKFVSGLQVACTLCRAFTTQGIVLNNFDVICIHCAEVISRSMAGTKEDADGITEANDDDVHVCKTCGDSFSNKGAFLRHCRMHKKEALTKFA